MREKSVIAQVIEVAAGAFAPGHLGVLTRFVDFDLVDAVLAVHGGAGARVRVLPGRVTVYFVLALALFEGCSYRAVWGKLAGALEGAVPGRVAASSLARARVRLGTAPVRALFEAMRGAVGDPVAPGVCWRGYRTVAIDGTTLKAPDLDTVTALYPRRRVTKHHTGYPLVRLVALVETGTRAVIGAVFGPDRVSEKTYALELAAHLQPDMPALADAFFDALPILGMLQERAGAYLVRSSAGRTPQRERVLADGSYLTTLHSHRRHKRAQPATLTARIIEAVITVTLADGTARTECWRLITSLLDPEEYPADDLIALYHERWQIETAYAQLKTVLLTSRVLRSRTPEMIEQELWGILALYQILVRHVAETAHAAGLDTDRLSYTIALETARDQVTRAHGIHPTTPGPDPIARALLADLHPARPRWRLRARTVKSLSKYWSHHGRHPATAQQYTLGITIGIFEHGLPPRPRP